MVVNQLSDDFAPYASSNSVIKVIQQYRSHGLPDPLTAIGLEQIGVPPSMISFTLRSLVFLGFIDEGGNITQDFIRIRRATTEEYPAVLAEILRKAYLKVFTVADPAVDDEIKIADAFRIYEPGKQRAKMIGLFLGLCEEAGIVPTGKSKRRQVSTSRTSRVKRAAVPQVDPSPPLPIPPTPPGTNLPTDLHHAMTPLIKDLAEKGPHWTKNQRDAWKKTFDGLLDYAYPPKEGDTP